MTSLRTKDLFLARRAAVVSRPRFLPRVEELEPRLPPGTVLEWLLPLFASAFPDPVQPEPAVSGTIPAARVLGQTPVRPLSWLEPASGRNVVPLVVTPVTARPGNTPASLPAESGFSLEVAPNLSLNIPDLFEAAAAAPAPTPRVDPSHDHSAHDHAGVPVPVAVGSQGADQAPGSRGIPAHLPPLMREDLGLARTAGQLLPTMDDGGITSGPASDQDLVPVGSYWRYLDDGSNQNMAWRGVTFDDSGWAEGPAQLGYGDGDEATEVGYGLDENNKYITTYFRHTFTVDDPSVFQTLHVWLLRDDGAVVYVNGNEVYRSNMPTGPVTYLTRASEAIGGDDESGWYHSAIPATALLTGTNVVAVEIHQFHPASTDISFDFDLYGSVAVRFAVIGDFGQDGPPERAVANMVSSWYVDFIVTTGDNNYPSGETSTIVRNIGQYYCPFIRNPDAMPLNLRCDSGLGVNRFYPTPGNHDWDSTTGLNPYLNYFTLPTGSGNERYYEATWGIVHLFAVDADSREPNGTTSTSTQGNWFQTRLAAATEPWKIVAMHHPPLSSGDHGSTTRMQWPYQQWGATAVLSGHDHTYERIVRNGFPYFVNGLGGNPSRYNFGNPIQGSEARYNANWGAMYVHAESYFIYFAFLDVDYSYIDEYYIFR